MKGFNAVQERQMKIETLKRILEKAFLEGADVDIKKLKSAMALDYGTAFKKTVEYVYILQQVMGFQINEGIITNGRREHKDDRAEREFNSAIQRVLPVANQDEPAFQGTVEEERINEQQIQTEEMPGESGRPVSQ